MNAEKEHKVEENRIDRKTCLLETGGLYFGPKMIFIPPLPSENDIFSPSRDVSFLTTIVAFLL
jgi:hypothetical protein